MSIDLDIGGGIGKALDEAGDAIGAVPGILTKAVESAGKAREKSSQGSGHTANALTGGVQMAVAVMEQAINDEIGRIAFDSNHPKLLSQKFAVQRKTRGGERPWLTGAKLDPPSLLFRQPPSASGNVVSIQANLTFTSGKLEYLSNFIGDKITLSIEDLALTTSIILRQTRASVAETIKKSGTTSAAKKALQRLQLSLDVLTLVAEIPVNSLTTARVAPGDYPGAAANVKKRWAKQVGAKTDEDVQTLLAEVQGEMAQALAVFFKTEKANKTYPLLHCGYTPALPKPDKNASFVPYEVKESLDLNKKDARLSSLVYAMASKKDGIPKTYLSAWTDAWVYPQELSGDTKGQLPAGVMLIDDDLLLKKWVAPAFATTLGEKLGWSFGVASNGEVAGKAKGPKKSKKGFDQRLDQSVTAVITKVSSRPGYDVKLKAGINYGLKGMAFVDLGFPPSVDIKPSSTKHPGHIGHLESDEFRVTGAGTSSRTLQYRLDVDPKSDNGLKLTLVGKTEPVAPKPAAAASADLSDAAKLAKKLLPALFEPFETTAKAMMSDFLEGALRDLLNINIDALSMTAPFIFPTGKTFTFRKIVVTKSGDILVHPYYRST